MRLVRYWAFFCIGIGILALVGCGPSKEQGAVATIKVWHWMTDRDPVFQQLAKEYELKTGVKVILELNAPSDTYSQKVRAAAQGSNLPDIYGILGEKKTFSSFIKAGHVLDLTPFMTANNNAWKNSFFGKALAVNEFAEGNSYGVTPGVYGVPIDIMTIQMLYNKDLLKEISGGFDKIPATFADFLALGPQLKAKNIQGLISGWGEGWMIDCLANNYAFNVLGQEKVIATIKGEFPYTDPDWVRVFSFFKDMRDSGILATGIITMGNKTAEQLFADGKALFAFNGSWCVNVYKGMNPKLKYGVMMPPKASDKFPMAIWGGAGSSFMVNAHSKHSKEAVAFLEWLTARDQQARLAAATNNLPSNKECLSQVPDILAAFSKNMDLSTHPSVWGVSEMPQVTEAFVKGIQSIIIGERTPEQVAQDVQKVKERELAKKRK